MSLSLYDHLQTLFIIIITLEEFVLLKDLIGFSHLRELKFKHGFQYTINPLCISGIKVESTEEFPIYCPEYVNERRSILSTLGNFN